MRKIPKKRKSPPRYAPDCKRDTPNIDTIWKGGGGEGRRERKIPIAKPYLERKKEPKPLKPWKWRSGTPCRFWTPGPWTQGPWTLDPGPWTLDPRLTSVSIIFFASLEIWEDSVPGNSHHRNNCWPFCSRCLDLTGIFGISPTLDHVS
jgi:hypothetical protein